MATLHISFQLENENEWYYIDPTRDFPLLKENEAEEYPITLSNEIWDCIELELKRKRLSHKHVERDSVRVEIDTDDGQLIVVPKDVILKCFD